MKCDIIFESIDISFLTYLPIQETKNMSESLPFCLKVAIRDTIQNILLNRAQLHYSVGQTVSEFSPSIVRNLCL